MPKPKPTVKSSEGSPPTEVSNDGYYIRVSKKIIKNLGNYENVAIEISLQLPLHLTKGMLKEADLAVDVLSEFIDEKLEDEVKRL